MALRAGKVSGAFEKRAPGPGCSKAGYPVDSVVCFGNIYPLDRDLSGG